MKRIDLKELDVPIVIKIDSVQYIKNMPTQGIESGIASSLSCEQFVGIIVNKKYYFSKDDLIICKNTPKVKGTQEKIKSEDKWFQKVATDVRTPCSSLVISYIILNRFKNLIEQRRENVTVDRQLNPRFLYSNLYLLVRQH